MLTRSEKTYLCMTLAFLAIGFGLKTWRRASVRLGPFPDASTLALDSAHTADSLAATASANPGLLDTISSPASVSVPGAEVSTISQPGGTRTGSGFTDKIDLNRADAAGLMRIKGVGEKTAAAILAYRRAHGPFRAVRDLLQIKGIGEKKLEKLTPHIIL
jgi:competence protein ComEA